MKKCFTRKRLAIGAVVAVALYLLGGFFGVPLVARHIVLPMVAERVNGTVMVERFACNPLRFSMTLEGISVANQAGAQVAGVDRVYVNAQGPATVWYWSFVVREVTVDTPSAALAFDEHGRLNLLDLIKPSEQPSTGPITLPRAYVSQITVTDATVTFEDHALATPFVYAMDDADVELTDFATVADHASHGQVSARFSDGFFFNWQGQFAIDPLSSQGTALVRDFAPATLQAYVSEFLDITIQSGRAMAQVEYDVAPHHDQPRMTVVLSGGISDFAVATSSEEAPMVSIEAANIDGLAADGIARTATFQARAGDGTHQVTRRADGSIDIIEHLLPDVPERFIAAKEKVEPIIEHILAQEPWTAGRKFNAQQDDLPLALEELVNLVMEQVTGPWHITAEKISSGDQQVVWRDETFNEPVELFAKLLSFQTDPIRSDNGFVTDFQARATLDPEGQDLVEAIGKVQPLDLTASVDFDLKGVDLSTASPYLTIFGIHLDLTSGNITSNGTLTATYDLDKPIPDVTLTGFGQIDNFDLHMIESDGSTKRLLAWETAKARDMDLSTATMSGTIARVEALSPYVALVVDQQRSPAIMHYLDFLKSGDAAATGQAAADNDKANEPTSDGEPLADGASDEPAEASSPAEKAEDTKRDMLVFESPFALSIDEVSINGGEATLVDMAQDPDFSLPVKGIAISLNDLTTDLDTKASLDFAAKLPGEGQIKAVGTLIPAAIEKDTTLNITIDRAAMVSFESYAKRYAGYGIEQGKATLNLTYTIANQKLQGVNDIALVKFYLADKVESDDAMNLPIPLALGLLRDSDERIELDVAIDGDLSNPQIKLTEVILDQIVGTVLKVATSPFGFLAKTFASDDRELDLSYVRFDPASDRLQNTADEKLDVLAKAMQERPALSLTIIGHVDQQVDLPILKRRALIRQARGDDQPAHEESPPTMDRDAYVGVVIDRYEQLTGQTGVRDRMTGEEATKLEGIDTSDEQQTSEDDAAEDRSRRRRVIGPRRGIGGGRVIIVQPRQVNTPSYSESASESESESGSRGPDTAADVPSDDASATPDVPTTEAATQASDTPAEDAITFESVESRVLASIDVDQSTLDGLTQARAAAVKAQLVDKGVDASRIDVSQAGPDMASDIASPDTAIVTFELR